ncbi:hypothetical protein Hdeb2414_s0001g00038471 [Helianthus debilis subsp. tardiflorus]
MTSHYINPHATSVIQPSYLTNYTPSPPLPLPPPPPPHPPSSLTFILLTYLVESLLPQQTFEEGRAEIFARVPIIFSIDQEERCEENKNEIIYVLMDDPTQWFQDIFI